MDLYTKLVNKKTFVGTQPITFNKTSYSKEISYFTTYKLDGLRKLLLISTQNYLVNIKMEFKQFLLPKNSNLFENTLLDGEYKANKFFAFDILFYKGQDLRTKTLAERLEFLNNVINGIKSKKVILKEYLLPGKKGEICNNFFNLITKYSKEMETGEVDGIIFTPNSPYTASPVLKWKPLHLLSIDFKIKKITLDSSKVELLLLTQNGSVFKPYGKYRDSGKVVLDPIEAKKYAEGDVVEFIFEKGKFVPIRVRKDKTKSNHISVILDNFKTIQNPPTMKKILC
jgi:hypothetical protein